jgi:hypothetical protein
MRIATLGFLYFGALFGNYLTDLEESQAIVDFQSLELHTIPNLLSDDKLSTIQNWIDDMMPFSYQDFDNRIGIVWDDYVIDIQDSPTLISIDPVSKYVVIKGQDVEQYPRSIFSYPTLSQILLKDILPPYLKSVSHHTPLPSTLYMQTFVLRSLLNPENIDKKQHVRWHQDPSEYPNSYADYTLVLMLSDPENPLTGWSGGDLLLKNGLPETTNPALKVHPRLNQAVLFNNKNNSHAVTSIKALANSTRDIMIINIYLQDPSK